MAKNWIYGPVPSRRLGRSLGVDLVPYKVCSYDCVYCQLGRTPAVTLARRPYVETEAVLPQLKGRLADGARPDYITLGGSGEPTLNSEIGRIIREIKALTDIPVALITNGSLLMDGEVRRQIAGADVVLPSFDACNPSLFQAINRPHPQISFEETVEGLIKFREKYKGLIWLEIFFVQGMNADEGIVKHYLPWMARFSPDKIHLNTAVRPTADSGVTALTETRLRAFAGILGPRAEVIAAYTAPFAGQPVTDISTKLSAMLSRRPCTLEDMAAGLGLQPNELVKTLEALLREGKVVSTHRQNKLYYQGVFDDLEK